MKYLITLLLLLTVAMPAYSQLSQSDLDKIQQIVDKSETRMKEYIDIKFETVDERFKTVNEQFANIDKRFDEVGGKINILTAIVCALIGLIGVVIALPAWRSRKDERALEKQMETLIQRIEALENGRIQSS